MFECVFVCVYVCGCTLFHDVATVHVALPITECFYVELNLSDPSRRVDLRFGIVLSFTV